MAFLACSLMGKPLHELQHLVESTHGDTHQHSDALQGESRTVPCGKSCRRHLNSSDLSHKEVGSDSSSGSHGSGEGHPEHSHDSHDCSVCQALCVAATSPNCCIAMTGPEIAVPLDAIDSESVNGTAPQSADARGPPGLA